MANDCKLGMVIGVSLVILIAVLFYRRDLGPDKNLPESAVAAKVSFVPAPTMAHQGYAR